MLGPLFNMFTAAMFIFFSGKFLNACKSRTKKYPLRQSHQPTFLLRQPAPYNPCSLFSHFRSWDYPEHFVIYSELVRKRKSWFFIVLIGYVSWIERNKILISQLSSPKFRYFANQNGPKSNPMKLNFDNFQIQKRSS